MKPEGYTLAKLIADFGLEKKGHEVTILNVEGLTSIADFFVIITGDSDTQLRAIADNIERKLREQKVRAYHKEGYKNLKWILMDYVDVVVHIFRGETREYYALERLWGDAKSEVITDEKNDN